MMRSMYSQKSSLEEILRVVLLPQRKDDILQLESLSRSIGFELCIDKSVNILLY